MLHHEAHELIDEMHDSKPERQENDHHDYHDDHYHDHYHSNYGSTHQDSNEYYHAHGGRSGLVQAGTGRMEARRVDRVPQERRLHEHNHSVCVARPHNAERFVWCADALALLALHACMNKSTEPKSTSAFRLQCLRRPLCAGEAFSSQWF